MVKILFPIYFVALTAGVGGLLTLKYCDNYRDKKQYKLLKEFHAEQLANTSENRDKKVKQLEQDTKQLQRDKDFLKRRDAFFKSIEDGFYDDTY